MDNIYFLAIFNERTWNEFILNGSSVYGTTLKKRKLMETIKHGDFLICYITRISRFVGVLEITSKPYLEYTHIWEDDVYPSRVNVQPVYILKAENGIPASNLKEDLQVFSNLKNQKSWGAFFRNSLKKIPEHDAKIIINKVKEASNK